MWPKFEKSSLKESLKKIGQSVDVNNWTYCKNTELIEMMEAYNTF